VNYSVFKDLLVVAVYHSTELEGRAEFHIGDLIRKYSLSVKPTWKNNLLKDLTDDWRLDMNRHLGQFDSQGIALSGNGLTWVEDEIGADNVSTYLEQNGALYVEKVEEIPMEKRIESANWTGISQKISDANLSDIRSRAAALNEAIVQSDADESTKANARARVDGVVKLLEAPDPPWKEIVEILNSQHLNALLVVTNLLQLILSFAK